MARGIYRALVITKQQIPRCRWGKPGFKQIQYFAGRFSLPLSIAPLPQDFSVRELRQTAPEVALILTGKIPGEVGASCESKPGFGSSTPERHQSPDAQILLGPRRSPGGLFQQKGMSKEEALCQLAVLDR